MGRRSMKPLSHQPHRRGTAKRLQTWFCFTAAWCVLVPVSFAVAQPAEMDPSALIDALSRQGMGELLEHLMKTQPPDDPVVARQVRIAQLRLEYQHLSRQADDALSLDPVKAASIRAKSLEVFEQMLQASRELIQAFYGHDARPIWQTDLAQALLFDYLQGVHQSAPLFEEFGVTTQKQRDALAQAGPEALKLLADADLRLFHLKGEIGRDLDTSRSRRLESSGLAFRLFDEYAKRRTPYFLSRAAYGVARLPDDSPYFTGLGSSDSRQVPNQKAAPDQERARLLKLSYEQLESFTGELSDLSEVRASSLSLRGRVLLAQGQVDEALKVIEALIESGEGGYAGFTAQMARVSALARLGRYGQAQEALAGLRDGPMVVSELRYRLLVADLTHRVMHDLAVRLDGTARDEAVAASYEPYLSLLSAPVSGDRSQGLRDFIYKRWASTVQDHDQADALPPMVRMAVSQVMRQEGQRLAQQILAAQRQGTIDEVDLDELREKANLKLNAAIRLAQSLWGKHTPPTIRGEAMYNQAMAMYWLSPNDPANRLKLTAILTDLGQQMPEQAIAEEAITVAVTLLHEMHQVLPAPIEVQEAYERAVGVLFKQFPFSASADGERLYYGYAVLSASGRHREAYSMFGRVPFDHDDYFRAQRQGLLALREVYRQADPVDRPRVWRELESAMKRVTREAQPIADSLVNPDRARAARRCTATAKLLAADLGMDAHKYQAVLDALKDFEPAYPGESDLIGQALELRILALSDSHQHEALGETAKQMIADYPDEAAPVIDDVLSRADERIDRLRSQAAIADASSRQELVDEAEEQAKAAAMLSELLLGWAQEQGFDSEQLMPFELIRARTLRLSGRVVPAVGILRGLVDDYPHDAQVVLEYAQALYDLGDEDSLIEAVRYYDRLITGLDQPFPKEWWIAWMRRLQINDRLNEQTDEIPLRVRQLRLTDPDLGGPVTKQELERLEYIHSR